MLSLYEIKNEYRKAFEELHSMEGLTPEIIADSLAGIECQLEDKALNVGAYIKNLEAAINTMREYEKHMADRRKAVENKLARLKDYLLVNLVQCDIKSIKGNEFSITLKKAPVSVIIDDESKITKDFIREKISQEINKIAIKEAIESGQEVKGAHLEQRLCLQIK